MTEAIETAKFGRIQISEDEIIRVEDGLPGFKGLRKFVLIQNPDLEPIKFFQSVDNPVISFPLIDPTIVDETYGVQLNSEELGKLDLDRPEEAVVLSIVTLGEGPEDASANLLAPLVVNTRKMRAAQVFMLSSDYSVSEPLIKN